MKKLVMILAISIATFSFSDSKLLTGQDDPFKTRNILNNGQSVSEKLLELELTPENLVTVLKFYDVKYPEVVYQQAVLESGNFSSYLCRKNNNIFGMYNPGKGRPTTSSGPCSYGYATYEHWTKSVEDYKMWQDMSSVDTPDYYSYLVKRGYAESKVYIQRLRSVPLPDNFRTL